MFALALWDRRRERLVLARDRVGKKPLLWTRLADGTLAFASELKALLRLPELPRELDLDAARRLPRAPVRARRPDASARVHKLPPGTCSSSRTGRERIERYWRAEARPTSRRVERGASGSSACATTVRAAVRRRLVADVPLGALLSGGIDSSDRRRADGAGLDRARAHVHGRLRRPRATTSARYARAVAERYGTEHEELVIEPDAAEAVERLAQALRRAVRRRGRAADLPRLRGGAAARHGRAGRRRRRRGLRRLRALPRRIALAAGAARAAARVAPARARCARCRAARREPRSTLVPRAPASSTSRPPHRRERYGAPDGGLPGRAAAAALDAERARGRRLGDLLGTPRARRPAGLQLLDVETYLAGRPAVQGRHRLDGVLARAALAVPRPRGARARARAARPAEAARAARQARAPARVRRRPAARGRRRGKSGFGVPLGALVPRATCASSRATCCSADRARARPLPPGAGRAPARRARERRADHGAPALVPLMLELWQRTHVDAVRPALATRVSRRRLRRRRGASASLPRLAVLLSSAATSPPRSPRRATTSRARSLDSGTFGFIPGVPSAYTQPLYGFFLVPLYVVFERHWLAIGLAQIARRGRRRRCSSTRSAAASSTPRAAVVAALIATLHPYLVWHDVHVNREILDQLARARRSCCSTLVVAERGGLLAARRALGGVAGLAILGELAPAAAAAPARGLPALAPARVDLAGRRSRSSRRRRSSSRPWVVRNQRPGRLLRDHDRRARALEGEQREHLRDARERRLDRRRAELPGAPDWPELASLYKQRPGASSRTRRVRADALLPGACGRLLARAPGREGEARRPRRRAALAAARDRDGGPARPRTAPSTSRATCAAAAVHDPALRCSRSPASASSPRPFVVLALALLAYQTRRRDALRRHDALPRRRGTSCSPCSPRPRRGPLALAAARLSARGRPRPPDLPGSAAPERHLLDAAASRLARARRRAPFVGPRRPGAGRRTPFYERARAAGGSPRAESARPRSRLAIPAAPAPRARARPRPHPSSTRTARRRARPLDRVLDAARGDEAQRRPVPTPAAFRFVERAARRARAARSIAITDSLARFARRARRNCPRARCTSCPLRAHGRRRRGRAARRRRDGSGSCRARSRLVAAEGTRRSPPCCAGAREPARDRDLPCSARAPDRASPRRLAGPRGARRSRACSRAGSARRARGSPRPRRRSSTRRVGGRSAAAARRRCSRRERRRDRRQPIPEIVVDGETARASSRARTPRRRRSRSCSMRKRMSQTAPLQVREQA